MGNKGPKGLEKVKLVKEALNKAMEEHSRTIERLRGAGVLIVDDKRCIIAPDAVIGRDTVIYPDVVIEEGVVIGEGNIIYPGCRIYKSTLGNFCEVQSAVILESVIGNDVTIGPFAYIRPESIIHDGVKIGDFVEIKKSELGEGTKVSHLTYIGDAHVGKDVNFGCGTVTVNYDGKNKYKTVVGDHCFIGCNTNLVAPVTLGDNVYTAAGSTLTKDVNSGSLVIARAREEHKEGWVEKKGLKK